RRVDYPTDRQPVRVAIVHNFYTQAGGEDEVFRSELELLDSRGHEVVSYTVSNEQVAAYAKPSMAAATVWNWREYRKVRNLLSEFKPDVVHVHNTLPLVSPAVYYAALWEGAAIDQTIHNYRPFCLNGVLYREGRVCTD